jgi:hypothetical protein|tara:strand:- start:2146 stop:2493 length:348 start_codon:yes stop_codon:yes gene_type:complete
MRVEVYYNLHKHIFSVRHKGRVIAHMSDVTIMNPTYVVRQAGRLKVLKEGRKNVHAMVRGEMSEEIFGLNNGVAVTYDPYKYSSFVTKADEQPILESKVAVLHKPEVGGPKIMAY